MGKDQRSKRFNQWIEGISFKEISENENVTINTVIKDITHYFRYSVRIGNYCINTHSNSHFGDVFAVKEIQECIEKYPYKNDSDPCYCLWSEGIYKRNEKTFRDFYKKLIKGSLTIIKKDHFTLVKNVNTNYTTNKHSDKSISIYLNDKPQDSKLIQVINNKDGMFAIFSVPLYSIG